MDFEEEKEVTLISNKSKYLVHYALLLVVAVVFFIAIFSSLPPGKFHYERKAIGIMKENLKDPKSAEFLEIRTSLINKGEDGARVYLKIRAKNSFNAYVIGEYWVNFDEDEHYELQKILK